MLAMEQMTLPFEQTEHFTLSVTCDGHEVDLPDAAPARFDTFDEAHTYLLGLRLLLQDSGYAIEIDVTEQGWVGVQKLSTGQSVIWRGTVVQHYT